MTILVCGEALVDVIQHADGTLTAATGGSPYNAARTIARLGQPTAFIGRLSTDRFGRLLHGAMTADGVDLSRAPRTGEPTTLAMAEIGPDGSARYSFYTAATSAAGLTEADLPTDFAGVDALLVGSLGLVLEPGATALTAWIERLPADLPLVVDPNCRPGVIGAAADAYRARMRQVFGRADVVKASTEDLDYLFPGLDADTAAETVRAIGPAVVLVTDGPHPLRVVTGAGSISVAIPPVAVADTIGAGDSFAGGFLAWWVGHGKGRADLADEAALAAAVAFGIRVAGVTTGRKGANPPTFADIGGWGD